MKRIAALLLCLLWGFISYSQQNDIRVPDSLDKKSFSYFNAGIAENKRDTVKATIYAQAWLAKAKGENSHVEKAAAYRALMHYVPKKLRIIYADSLLIAALSSADDAIIGSAYLTKGLAFYDGKQHIKALDNYILADNYISRTHDEYLVYKVKYAIALTKYYLGFYDEAISLFRECVKYFQSENDLAYLKSLHTLGLSYNRVYKYDLCTQNNQAGLAAGKELQNLEMEPYFIHSEGVNQYFKKDYHRSIALLKQSLPNIAGRNDFANKTI
ncbi:MAG TPA: AraC family transcriptional regulator, partial [Flavobacterium sp.]